MPEDPFKTCSLYLCFLVTLNMNDWKPSESVLWSSPLHSAFRWIAHFSGLLPPPQPWQPIPPQGTGTGQPNRGCIAAPWPAGRGERPLTSGLGSLQQEAVLPPESLTLAVTEVAHHGIQVVLEQALPAQHPGHFYSQEAPSYLGSLASRTPRSDAHCQTRWPSGPPGTWRQCTQVCWAEPLMPHVQEQQRVEHWEGQRVPSLGHKWPELFCHHWFKPFAWSPL